jgi:hypothetical protein
MITVARWQTPFGPENLDGFVSAADVAASPADILLMRLIPDANASPSGSASTIPHLVANVRRRHPGCPVVLWVSGVPPQTVIDAVVAASGAQVRGILGGEKPEPKLLRAQLTEPTALSSFILRWASDTGYLPEGAEQDDVRALLDAAPEVRTLNRLSRNRHIATRTWRSHLQQLGLPAPRAWLGLGHALHVAFFVQRHSSESFETLAHRLGMQTVARMSQQFRRTFELSPGSVREMIGAEPLLHRWFEKHVRFRAERAAMNPLCRDGLAGMRGPLAPGAEPPRAIPGSGDRERRPGGFPG